MTKKKIAINAILILLRCCHAVNVVIEQKSQCNIPLSTSAKNEGDPDKLSFTEYLDFVDNLIQDDPAYTGKVDVENESIKEYLNGAFHSLANETCNFYLSDDECSNDFIHIYEGVEEGIETPLQRVFLFNVCERAFEFVIDEVSSAAPSLSPSIVTTLLPTSNNRVTVFNTIQVEVDVGNNNEPAEVAVQHNVPASFEELVEEVMSEDGTCLMEYISTNLAEPGKKIPCEAESRLGSIIENSRICYEYTFETTIGHDGSACGANIASDIGPKIDEASINGDLEAIFCEGEVQCTIAIMLGKKREFLVPIVSGLACAAFVFIGFMGYHGKKRRATRSQQDSNIEVAFPIPSLPDEENDPFEKEQTNPFEKEQSNPFERSTDNSFVASFR